MGKFFEFLSGKKTYVLVAIGLAVQGAVWLGFMTQDAANPILGTLGIGTAATIRAAVK